MCARVCCFRHIVLIPGSTQINSVCWKLASAAVDPLTPGIFNQGIMEFGALVCTPTSPSCNNCVLQPICKAYRLATASVIHDMEDIGCREGVVDVAQFPKKVAKKATPELSFDVCVVVSSSLTKGEALKLTGTDFLKEDICKYMLVRRPNKGLLARQWEFPLINAANGTGSDNVGKRKKMLQSMWDSIKMSLQTTIDAAEIAPILGKSEDYVISEHSSVRHVFSQETHSYRVFSCIVYEPSTTIKNENVDSAAGKRKKSPIDFSKYAFTESTGGREDPSKRCRTVGSEEIADSSGADSVCREAKWLTYSEIQAMGLTTGCKKILKSVLSGIS
jgi:adenine-specific DNA glycosylase